MLDLRRQRLVWGLSGLLLLPMWACQKAQTPAPSPGPAMNQPDYVNEPTTLARAIRERLPPLRACYEHELRNEPVAGRLMVMLSIGRDGAVLDAAITEDAIRKPELNECVLGRMRLWRFEGASEAVDVEVPLDFSPTE